MLHCIHHLVLDDKSCFWISLCSSHAIKGIYGFETQRFKGVCINSSSLLCNGMSSCKGSFSCLVWHIGVLRVCPYGHVFKCLPENWCSAKIL